MMPIPRASPDPPEETERRLALVWATLAARRDPAAGARRVTVLPPVAVHLLRSDQPDE
jgi:hypothetical protein